MDAVVGGPAQGTDLRGRASECAALDELIADARRGESRTLVVRGEAGIGKTALLRYATQRASDLRVAQIAGIDAVRWLLCQLCSVIGSSLSLLAELRRVSSGESIALAASSIRSSERSTVNIVAAQYGRCASHRTAARPESQSFAPTTPAATGVSTLALRLLLVLVPFARPLRRSDRRVSLAVTVDD